MSRDILQWYWSVADVGDDHGQWYDDLRKEREAATAVIDLIQAKSG